MKYFGKQIVVHSDSVTTSMSFDEMEFLLETDWDKSEEFEVTGEGYDFCHYFEFDKYRSTEGGVKVFFKPDFDQSEGFISIKVLGEEARVSWKRTQDRDWVYEIEDLVGHKVLATQNRVLEEVISERELKIEKESKLSTSYSEYKENNKGVFEKIKEKAKELIEREHTEEEYCELEDEVEAFSQGFADTYFKGDLNEEALEYAKEGVVIDINIELDLDTLDLGDIV